MLHHYHHILVSVLSTATQDEDSNNDILSLGSTIHSFCVHSVAFSTHIPYNVFCMHVLKNVQSETQ